MTNEASENIYDRFATFSNTEGEDSDDGDDINDSESYHLECVACGGMTPDPDTEDSCARCGAMHHPHCLQTVAHPIEPYQVCSSYLEPGEHAETSK